MTDKKFGCGCGTDANHCHTELPPVIHVHNKTPFNNYDEAVNAIKAKSINPGEIIIVYYNDPGTEGGVDALIVTGPIQAGGTNKIFKSAEDIDDLVDYLTGLINAQDEAMRRLAEEIQQQVTTDLETIKQQLIDENTRIIGDAVSEINSKFDASFNQVTVEINQRLDASLDGIEKTVSDNASVLQSELDELKMYVDSSDNRLKRNIDASYLELKSLIGYDSESSDASIKAYIDEKIYEEDAKINALRNNLNASIMRVEN